MPPNLGDQGSTLTAVHGRIHKGQFFSSCELTTLDDTIIYSIMTGSNSAHISFDMTADGEAEVTLYKQSIIDVQGSLLTTLNANDFSTNGNTTEIFSGATLLDTGTKWDEILILSGSGPQSTGSTLGPRIEEFILKTNNIYSVEINNQEVSDIKYNIRFGWYEPGT